ncbi:hypothetical protein DXG03_001082 [Asterophora parasitica]|uniref:Uncharacterized protein n=1 Tax=Asterophora parasitica TaxID=117018 RepID=A0A9P7GHH3_9AGAR|nr:hypothetical protein DXG03_001082 [Asterophora parasitica]
MPSHHIQVPSPGKTMVHLVLSSTKVVRTKIDDDVKQLQAKSITISVRCYESRLGRVSVLHSNVLVDYTQVLWSKPDDEEFALIDDLEFPFRLTIPAKVMGFSTAVFVDYRCMWRVEAVLNHMPIPGVGSRQIKHFELPLIRFDLPPHQPTPPNPTRSLLLHHQTTKPKAPRIRYVINTPTTPIGPLDIVCVPVFLHPLDEGVTIRTATVMIERRIQLNETFAFETTASPYPIPSSSNSASSRTSPSSSPSNSYSPSSSYIERSSSKFDGEATITSDSSSNPTITPNSVYPSTTSFTSETPLLSTTNHSPNLPSSSSSPSHAPSKIIVTPVTGAESSGHFSRDDEGVWSKTVTLQWPAAKSHSRWAIGETIQSELVSVRFFARVKVSVSSPNGTESIELGEKELLIVSTNEAERQLAITKFNDLMYNHHAGKSGRSKSKSPRRARRDPDLDLPPPPAPYKAGGKLSSSSTGSVKGTATGQGSSSGGGKVPTLRRPHTSAGPRDKKSLDFAAAQARMEVRAGEEEVFRNRNGESSTSSSRPATSPRTGKRRSGVVSSLFGAAPRISTALSGSSNGTSASGSRSGSVTRSTSSSVSSQGDGDIGPEEKMREWEEELAKIEMLSRKSSAMLGFFGKRKRSVKAPRGDA